MSKVVGRFEHKGELMMLVRGQEVECSQADGEF